MWRSWNMFEEPFPEIRRFTSWNSFPCTVMGTVTAHVNRTTPLLFIPKQMSVAAGDIKTHSSLCRIHRIRLWMLNPAKVTARRRKVQNWGQIHEDLCVSMYSSNSVAASWRRFKWLPTRTSPTGSWTAALKVRGLIPRRLKCLKRLNGSEVVRWIKREVKIKGGKENTGRMVENTKNKKCEGHRKRCPVKSGWSNMVKTGGSWHQQRYAPSVAEGKQWDFHHNRELRCARWLVHSLMNYSSARSTFRPHCCSPSVRSLGGDMYQDVCVWWVCFHFYFLTKSWITQVLLLTRAVPSGIC